MKNYFPILLSKAGELKALKMIAEDVKERITPIIQVLDSKLDLINKTFTSSSGSYDELFLDFSLASTLNRDQINNLILGLIRCNISIIPVIQANSINAYTMLIKELLEHGDINQICIRFSAKNGGFSNIVCQLSTLENEINISRDNISVIFDLKYTNELNFQIFADSAVASINLIQNLRQYKNIIIASGSFPENLSHFVAKNIYQKTRYEWLIWNILRERINLQNIKYSDYGTKYPIYFDQGFQGTCSLKYSTENDFIIHRGEKAQNNKDGNGQYIQHARALISSQFYAGIDFSWGDMRIFEIGKEELTNPKNKPGNSTSWVEISQNHHITLIDSLFKD